MNGAGGAPADRRSLLHWGAIWTALALFSGSWLATIARVESRSFTWDRSLAIQLGSFLLWALLAVPMVGFARRFPWLTGRRIAASGARALLALAAALLHSAVLSLLLAGTLPRELWISGWSASFRHAIRFQLHFNLLIAALVLFADLALGWYRRSAERRLEAARLEEGLVKARLAASRLRLRPRFLFDAIATVRRRLGDDPAEAERLVLRLASLLRAVLESWRHPDSTVRDEVELARIFVELERARLGVGVELAVDADPDALALELPSLILIPLLDDAVAARAGTSSGTRPIALALRVALRDSDAGGVVELVVGPDDRDARRAPAFSAESLAVARERLAEPTDPASRTAAPATAATLELAVDADGRERLTLHLPPAAASRAERSDPIRPQEVLWSRS